MTAARLALRDGWVRSGLEAADVPRFAGLAALAVMAGYHAGYSPTRWLPAAVFLVLLLVVALATVPRGATPSRPTLVALGALTALALWSYASILWAADQGRALDGANRTLLYAVVFALFGLWRARGRSVAAALAIWAGYLGVIATVALLQLDGARELDGLFTEGRLSSIAGYTNGSAAFLMLGFVPAVALAARRETPWPVRGVLAGCAVVLIDVAALSQSRTMVFVLPVVLLVWLAAVPGRLRALATLAVVAGGAALTLPDLLDRADRYRESLDTAQPLGTAFSGGAAAVVIAAAAVGIIVALIAFADRRTQVPAPVKRRISVVVAAVAGAVAVVGIVGALAFADPGGRISDAWSSFKADSSPTSSQQGRISAGLGGRYDLFRVSLDILADHPIVGIGSENFLDEFLIRKRPTSTDSRFPHSLVLRALAQLGVVGGLLLAGLLGAAAVAGWRAVRRPPPFAAAVAGAAAMSFLYFVLHGSFDWFWEIAGIGAPAFAMLALACAAAPGAVGERAARPWLARTPAIAAAIAAAAGAVVVLGAPWLSQRWTDAAASSWRADPAGAFDNLDRAAAVDPLSETPYLTAAVIATEVDDLPRARSFYRKALERHPDNAFVYLQLGAIASEFGQRAEAIRLLERAQALSPHDLIVREALEAVRRGETVQARDINRQINERTSKIVR